MPGFGPATGGDAQETPATTEKRASDAAAGGAPDAAVTYVCDPVQRRLLERIADALDRHTALLARISESLDMGEIARPGPVVDDDVDGGDRVQDPQ